MADMEDDLDMLFQSQETLVGESHKLEFESQEPICSRDLQKIESNINQIQQFRKNQTNVLKIVQKYTFEMDKPNKLLKTTFYRQMTPTDQKLVNNYFRGSPVNRKLVYQQIVDEQRKRDDVNASVGMDSVVIPFGGDSQIEQPATDTFQGKTYFITQQVD